MTRRAGSAAADAAAEPPSIPRAAAAALLGWYGRAARDLPWRRTRDPYRILVSEIMLQQTRVETVIDRYARFLDRFPTLAALAAASEDDVLAEWSGLGYYRRPRNLHRLARLVVDRHDGTLPSDYDAMRALPGLGEYTAAAVASIAFDRPHLSIDGNVARVLCRLLAITDDPGRAAVKRALRAAAAPALATHEPSQLNQALMELGALVCLPRAPRCDACPCRGHCAAADQGLTASIPPARKQPIHDVHEAAAVIERDGRYLLFRGQRRGVLETMWEFPTLDSRQLDAAGYAASHRHEQVVAEPPRTPATSGQTSQPELEDALRTYLSSAGYQNATLTRIGAIRHGITNRRIHCHVYRATCRRPAANPRDVESAWFAAHECDSIPLAASARKILQLL